MKLNLTVRLPNGEIHKVAAIYMKDGEVYRIMTQPAIPFGPFYSIEDREVDLVELVVMPT